MQLRSDPSPDPAQKQKCCGSKSTCSNVLLEGTTTLLHAPIMAIRVPPDESVLCSSVGRSPSQQAGSVRRKTVPLLAEVSPCSGTIPPAKKNEQPKTCTPSGGQVKKCLAAKSRVPRECSRSLWFLPTARKQS